MEVKELNPGHVVVRIARFRYVVVMLTQETRQCGGCAKFLHRRTKCVRKDKANKRLYWLCGDCTEKEIEDHGNNE